MKGETKNIFYDEGAFTTGIEVVPFCVKSLAMMLHQRIIQFITTS
jgi:hypothetical protein